MTLFHGYFRSSAAYRCRIAFNLKGFQPETLSVHLRKGGGEQKSPAYRALNPQALVPALEVDGAVLTQSLAIIEWLDETIPEPPLLPESPIERAKVRALAQLIACDTHPLQNLRVLDYLRQEYGQDQAGLDRWCQKWVCDGLAAAEQQLTQQTRPGRFAFGDSPTLADVALIPQLFSADRFGIDLAQMPRLQEIRASCDALPAFQQAHPSLQPDAE